jgi:hypothetical protein
MAAVACRQQSVSELSILEKMAKRLGVAERRCGAVRKISRLQIFKEGL